MARALQSHAQTKPSEPPALGRALDRALSNCGDGVAVCRSGEVVWANARLAQIAGCGPAEQLLGKPIDAVLADGAAGLPGRVDEDGIELRLKGLGREGPLVQVRRLTSQDGAEIWIVAEVTRLRGLEQEVLRVSRALQDANRELATLRERAVERAREREELFTVLSHELRTPVTVISGYTRLLLSAEVGPLTEEQQRFLRESARSCQRLDAFIGKLIAASRETDGGGVLDLHDASIESAIDGVVRLLRPLLAERELQVELRLDPDARRARFDLMRVEQVLTNLLGNALRYAQRGGTIEVATQRLEAAGHCFVEVSVSDDGPGISEADRARIFEPYVRAGAERRAGGLGLGLAICKRIVEAHRGTIVVTERDGGGSRFAFTLPASRA